MRMDNSHARALAGHNINFRLLIIRKTQETKLIERMSDITFDHDASGEFLGLRVKEQYEIGLHKIILAKQLGLLAKLCAISTNITIILHFKIEEEVVVHVKTSAEHKNEKRNKMPSNAIFYEVL